MTAPARAATLRRFRAGTAREAMDQVRSAFGDGAVIVESRSVGGVFGEPRIEVTATGREPASTPRPAVAGEAPSLDVATLLATARRLEHEVAGLRRGLQTRPRRSADTLVAWLGGCGIATDMAVELGDAVPEGTSQAHWREAVARRLRTRLECAAPPWRKREGGPGTRYLALVGVSGAGKTLTAIKLAARAVLESGLRVGLLSTDVHRVGAREQLGDYARLMNLPVRFASDGAGLVAMAHGMPDRDLVLVDGPSHADPGERVRQFEILRALPAIEPLVVLPATVSALDAEAQLAAWLPAAPRAVIVSKTDEAAGPGGLLSGLLPAGLPIAALATGPRIPQDSMEATPAALVDLFLGAA